MTYIMRLFLSVRATYMSKLFRCNNILCNYFEMDDLPYPQQGSDLC